MTSFAEIGVQFEPLRQWPDGHERTPVEKRGSSRFRAPYSSTLELLEKELRMLGAENVVVQMDIHPGAIRNDGLPYSNAKMPEEESGVVLSFEVGGEQYMYPCDSYADWKDNLRAIALTLEKLRAVDRYGVSQSGEQYVGWRALPEDVDDRLGPEEAARLIVATAGHRSAPDYDDIVQEVLHDEGEAAGYLREARKRSHPDMQTGNEAHFKRVQTAGHVLEQHFGNHKKGEG